MASGNYGLKRSVRLWCVEFFGILHCVQDDSRNCNQLQRQLRMQRQVRSWGQQKLAMADADERRVRSWGCGMHWVRSGFSAAQLTKA